MLSLGCHCAEEQCSGHWHYVLNKVLCTLIVARYRENDSFGDSDLLRCIQC